MTDTIYSNMAKLVKQSNGFYTLNRYRTPTVGSNLSMMFDLLAKEEAKEEAKEDAKEELRKKLRAKIKKARVFS